MRLICPPAPLPAHEPKPRPPAPEPDAAPPPPSRQLPRPGGGPVMVGLCHQCGGPALATCRFCGRAYCGAHQGAPGCCSSCGGLQGAG